jgi:hypothetical protein
MTTDDEKKSPVLEVMDGGMPKGDLASKFLGGFLDVKGTNFFGSGMSFPEWSATADFLRYRRSFVTQPLEEQTRRLKYIVALSAELERMRQTDVFATAWCEYTIKTIIEGDWKMVAMWTESMLFKEEIVDIRNLAAPRFAKFVEIATEAYETRPKVFCPVCHKPPPAAKLASWQDGRHVCPWCDLVFDDTGKSESTGRARLHTVDGGE